MRSIVGVKEWCLIAPLWSGGATSDMCVVRVLFDDVNRPVISWSPNPHYHSVITNSSTGLQPFLCVVIPIIDSGNPKATASWTASTVHTLCGKCEPVRLCGSSTAQRSFKRDVHSPWWAALPSDFTKPLCGESPIHLDCCDRWLTTDNQD